MREKLYLQDIIPLDKLKKQGNILLIRHSPEKLDEMVKKNLIDEYQRFESKPAFRDCRYVVSFLGCEGNTGTFYGIFEVVGIQEKVNLPKFSKELSKYCKPQDKNKLFHLKWICRPN